MEREDEHGYFGDEMSGIRYGRFTGNSSLYGLPRVGEATRVTKHGDRAHKTVILMYQETRE